MKETALSRYHALATDRQQFIESARECAELTLPYLMVREGQANGQPLPIPWQSVGAKGVNVLASKLMLSLFPVNTSFFKLQINDAELAALPNLTPEIRSEVDLSLSKMERMITQQIAESSDRVYLTTAMKHLVVTGNALVHVGKQALKVYPLDRYVVNRDGEGNVIEIVTLEMVHRSLLPAEFQKATGETGAKDVNSPGADGPRHGVGTGTGKSGSSWEEAEVYTWVRLKDGQWYWHQEADGKVIPGTNSQAPKSLNPWLALRFNVVDGEDYGRGRVEEFLGDLKSLEGLMKAMVEGSAAMAKLVFVVNPSSALKPGALANAQNGAIIVGRPDDVGVVQGNKAADFRTVQEMIRDLTARLSDAFLILNPRQSERTTAAEITMIQQELNEQLGGIFGTLTAELLYPYLLRKLHLLKKQKAIPPLPKGLVLPTVVAGLNGIGRGQEKANLMEFVTTIAQSMGPEALAQHINPGEFLKRLAAASGIDTLNLIKTPEQIQEEQQAALQSQMASQLVGQAGQLAKSPIGEQLINQNGSTQAPTPQGQAV